MVTRTIKRKIGTVKKSLCLIAEKSKDILDLFILKLELFFKPRVVISVILQCYNRSLTLLLSTKNKSEHLLSLITWSWPVQCNVHHHFMTCSWTLTLKCFTPGLEFYARETVPLTPTMCTILCASVNHDNF